MSKRASEQELLENSNRRGTQNTKTNQFFWSYCRAISVPKKQYDIVKAAIDKTVEFCRHCHSIIQ